MNPRILNVLELQVQLQNEQITTLVHRFYERVQQEPVLSSVFANHIAADQWPMHLDKMVRFWSTILRGTNRYTGNPMIVHSNVRGLTTEHFRRWLKLFREVAEEHLPQVLADSILQRAERMGRSLRGALNL